MKQGLDPFKKYRFTIPSFRIRSLQELQVYNHFIQDQIPTRITGLKSLHLGLDTFKNYRFRITSFRIRSLQVLQVLQSLHLGINPFKDYRYTVPSFRIRFLQRLQVQNPRTTGINPLIAYERIQELEVYNPFIVHEGIGSSQEFRVYNSFIVMEGVDPFIKLQLFNIIKNPEEDPPPDRRQLGGGGHNLKSLFLFIKQRIKSLEVQQVYNYFTLVLFSNSDTRYFTKN